MCSDKTGVTPYKIVLLGNGGVGKSTITCRYCSGIFVNYYDPTIEDLYRKLIEIEKKQFCLEILDTAGTEQMRSMAEVDNRVSGNGFIFIFSITDENSFNAIPEFISGVNNVKGVEIPKLIVGNKIDLGEERVISIKDASNLASKYNCKYMEVSAKTDRGINDIFYDMAFQIYAQNSKRKKHEDRCILQ